MASTIEVRCGICGTTSRHPRPLHPECLPGADIDTRPQARHRNAHASWAQRCPACGSCAADLSHIPTNVRPVVQSARYQSHLRSADFPELANRLLAAAMLEVASSELLSALKLTVAAAWACDDAKQPAEAADCRLGAAWLLRRLIREVGEPSALHFLLLADLLRRAGDFGGALAAVAKGAAPPSATGVAPLLDLERRLALAEDAAPRSVADAMATEATA